MRKTNSRGFTLIEMAIVLVIITILISGLAVPLSAQIQARRIAETNKTLEEARNALMGYAMVTGVAAAGPNPTAYLPCPDTLGDGTEKRNATTGVCTNKDGTTNSVNGVSYGWFPWATLGTAPQDAWGNRLRYVVISQFANSATGGGFHLKSISPPNSLPDIQICSSSTSSSCFHSVAFALISHGPNGWGAQNVNNAPGMLQAAPTGPDEKQNLAFSTVLVMRPPTPPGSALGEFDDLVASVSESVLVGLVCPTGSNCGY
jgi:prepilin-type N-terminal cleavage/methylation domain-containing protein